MSKGTNKYIPRVTAALSIYYFILSFIHVDINLQSGNAHEKFILSTQNEAIIVMCHEIDIF